MKQLDKEDERELEELKKLVSGKRLNLPIEELGPREATALLRYIDKLEGVEDVLPYDQNDLAAGLRKLVGMAATPEKKMQKPRKAR